MSMFNHTYENLLNEAYDMIQSRLEETQENILTYDDRHQHQLALFAQDEAEFLRELIELLK